MSPAADTRTVHHRLLDELMRARKNRPLATYVRNERAKERSWRHIAMDVADITGQDVSPPTLIAWFGEPKSDDGAA